MNTINPQKRSTYLDLYKIEGLVFNVGSPYRVKADLVMWF